MKLNTRRFTKFFKRAFARLKDNKTTKRQTVFLLFAVIWVVIVGVFSWQVLKSKNSKGENNSTPVIDAAQTAQSILKVPSDKQSSVCEAITKQAIAAALKIEIEATNNGIADAVTADGTVASCSYLAKDSEDNINSINIMERTLKSLDKAQEVYAQLTTDGGKPITGEPLEMFLHDAGNHAIIKKGSVVSTITINTRNPDTRDYEDALIAVAKLL